MLASVPISKELLEQRASSLVMVGVGSGLTVSVKVSVSAVQAGVWLLVAVMVMVYSPAVVGVPAMVLLLKVKPAGSVEVVTVELVLVMTTLVMALPAHTLWVRLVASKVTVGLTIRLKVISSGSQAGVWSLVAVMVMTYTPAVVGVPVIASSSWS